MAITAPAIAATGVAVLNTTGQQVDATVTGGAVQGILSMPPISPIIATPAIPASTVTTTNTNAFPVAVTVTGGTVTVVAVNGSTIFTATPCTVVVPAGGTIAITYTVVPTSWTWTPLFAGIAANPVASPSTVGVLVNGLVSVIYSAAPTWAWTNPPTFDESGYGGPNTSQNNPLAWPWEVAHSEAGQAGLGFGVSN